jgi:hypothetical protein
MPHINLYINMNFSLWFQESDYFTVTAEKAMKHSAAKQIRNRPHRAKFIVPSSVTMYLYIRVHISVA